LNPHEEHRKKGATRLGVRVVTVSTSRHSKSKSGAGFTDEGGDAAEAQVKAAGHLVSRGLVPDDPQSLKKEVDAFLRGEDDVLILTGGTGISSTDVTIETVRPYFQKELDGFGELVRRLSFDEVGSASVLTRATMGVVDGKLILCLPGSPGGVRTALRAFVGELPHSVYIARS
jgi:molybdopterin adenylyltransferase